MNPLNSYRSSRRSGERNTGAPCWNTRKPVGHKRRGTGRIGLHCAGGAVNLARRRKERYFSILINGNALLCLNTTASQQ
jgi:hypothetical protein